MQDIRHPWCWRCGEKFAALIFCDLALVDGPSDINQSADADDREGEDQRILAFDVPHDQMPSENLFGLLRRRGAILMKDVWNPR